MAEKKEATKKVVEKEVKVTRTPEIPHDPVVRKDLGLD